MQSLTTLPAGFTGKPWAADLHLTPDGRFLYTSERTTSTLAGFASTRPPASSSCSATRRPRRQPRGFNIDPSGRYLVASDRLSHA